MGRWAQYRKRGSTRESLQPPPPPSPSDWTWTFDEDNDQGIASFIGTPPAGQIGWQLFAEDSDPPAVYRDQALGALTDLFYTGPLPSDEDIFASVRFILSGAGDGDPDSTYTDQSASKSFHTP